MNLKCLVLAGFISLHGGCYHLSHPRSTSTSQALDQHFTAASEQLQTSINTIEFVYSMGRDDDILAPVLRVEERGTLCTLTIPSAAIPLGSNPYIITDNNCNHLRRNYGFYPFSDDFLDEVNIGDFVREAARQECSSYQPTANGASCRLP